MMPHKKRILSIVIALCMVFTLLLTACSNGGNTSPNDTTTPGVSDTQTPGRTPDGTETTNPDSNISNMPEAPASDFEYRKGSNNDRIIITKYIGKSTSVKIPEIIDGLPVMSIDDSAFEGCIFLTSVVIPNRVVFIGEFVFRNCTALTDVTMPYNGGGLITEIVAGDGDTYQSTDRGIFDGCDSLKSITAIVSDSVTSITWRAFADCTHLVNVIIPEGVEFIGEEAFMNCTSLTSLTLPKSILSMHCNAFKENSTTKLNLLYTGQEFGDDYQCLRGLETPVKVNVIVADGVAEIETGIGTGIGENSNIVSITIPDSVTSICLWAFRNLNHLESVQIGNGITELQPKTELEGSSYSESGLFQNLRSLKSVTLGNRITTIGDSTFDGCVSLTDLILPEGVTTIGNNAFANCTALKSISLPGSMTEIGSGAFSGNASLERIAIPEGITTISSSMFSGCESLTSVTIPKSVTVIDSAAFGGCKTLKTLTLPDGLTTIGDWAFWHCESLASIIIPDSVTEIGEVAFRYSPNLTATYKEKTYTATAPDKENWDMPQEFYDAINNG